MCDEFDGEQQHMYRAMLSWIHDGSHSSGDDLFFELDERSTETFLQVFKAVFEKWGCADHYEAMMKSSAMLSVPIGGGRST